MFKLRFNDLESKLTHKPVPNTTYLTLKQKRYKRRKKIPLFTKLYKDTNGVKNKFSGKFFVEFSQILAYSRFSPPTRANQQKQTTTMMPPSVPTASPQRRLSPIARCRPLADIMAHHVREFCGRPRMDEHVRCPFITHHSLLFLIN